MFDSENGTIGARSEWDGPGWRNISWYGWFAPLGIIFLGTFNSISEIKSRIPSRFFNSWWACRRSSLRLQLHDIAGRAAMSAMSHRLRFRCVSTTIAMHKIHDSIAQQLDHDNTINTSEFKTFTILFSVRNRCIVKSRQAEGTARFGLGALPFLPVVLDGRILIMLKWRIMHLKGFIELVWGDNLRAAMWWRRKWAE